MTLKSQKLYFYAEMQQMKKIIVIVLTAFLSQYALAGTVDTIEVYSNSMHKNIRCCFVTPSNMKSAQKKFPVIYLLHGYSGNYAQWITRAPQIQQQADEMQVIMVCPDGGYGSWYFDSPLDSSIRYETFVSKELVQFVDQHYPTKTSRQYRAITGLSMGGHGGLYLAIKHRDIFGAAGSTSGGVDFRPFPKSWELIKALGDTACCMANWDKNVVVNVIDQLNDKELSLIIDCGVDDFFLTVNRNLHAKLVEKKIEHDYIERPGGHNSAYWKNSIDYQLLFFKKFFEKG